MGFGRRESQFWQRIRKGYNSLKFTGERPLLQRIESPMTGGGIPDVFIADPDFGSCWVELKVAQYKLIRITDKQAAWLETAARLNLRTRIIVLSGVSSKTAKLSNQVIRIYDGLNATNVKNDGIRAKTISTHPHPFNWLEFRYALFKDRIKDEFKPERRQGSDLRQGASIAGCPEDQATA